MQNQGLHLLPVELKRIGITENVPELEVGLQSFAQLTGDHGRPAVAAALHLDEKAAMPPLSFVDPSVNLDRDSAEDVFDSGVERVQESCEGGKLDVVRSLDA